MTMRDRLVDARRYIQDMFDVVHRIKRPEDRVVVKYRGMNQQLNFPYDGENRVGYGTLLDLCDRDTIVIGPPGSAALECLLNDIRFYVFQDFGLYEANKYGDKEAVERLLSIIHVASNKDELFENIIYTRIYKPGHSKRNLIHQDGMHLNEVVEEILKRQCREKSV